MTRSKPEPDGLRHVLKGLGTPLARALYVGDTFADQECAARAGTGFAAATWGAACAEPAPSCPAGDGLEAAERRPG